MLSPANNRFRRPGRLPPELMYTHADDVKPSYVDEPPQRLPSKGRRPSVSTTQMQAIDILKDVKPRDAKFQRTRSKDSTSQLKEPRERVPSKQAVDRPGSSSQSEVPVFDTEVRNEAPRNTLYTCTVHVQYRVLYSVRTVQCNDDKKVLRYLLHLYRLDQC